MLTSTGLYRLGTVGEVIGQTNSLLVSFRERLRGVVDLGWVTPIVSAPGVVRIPYEAGDGTMGEAVVVDARALRDWLSHPRFHMPK